LATYWAMLPRDSCAACTKGDDKHERERTHYCRDCDEQIAMRVVNYERSRTRKEHGGHNENKRIRTRAHSRLRKMVISAATYESNWSAGIIDRRHRGCSMMKGCPFLVEATLNDDALASTQIRCQQIQISRDIGLTNKQQRGFNLRHCLPRRFFLRQWTPPSKRQHPR
jgi:hypothetical protein